jgi:hypothetical protein
MVLPGRSSRSGRGCGNLEGSGAVGSKWQRFASQLVVIPVKEEFVKQLVTESAHRPGNESVAALLQVCLSFVATGVPTKGFSAARK